MRTISSERRVDLAIDTRALHKRFGDVEAVASLDLRVPTGCVYGFLGLNGAGKTTTIRMLLGLLRPDAGDVHVFGRTMPRERLTVLADVGALVESPTVYGHLTGRENLEATRRLRCAEKSSVSDLLSLVGLTGAADRLVRGYSTGMRQRLGLALALLAKPKLLILDEPTNGLDPGGIQELRALIRDLPPRLGVTVFLSSHLLSEVEQVASHIGIIHRGRLSVQGETRSILAAGRRLQVIVTDPETALHILSGRGWDVVREGASLSVGAKDDEDAMAVNRALVQAGCGVSRLQFEDLTLERLFFASTQS